MTPEERLYGAIGSNPRGPVSWRVISQRQTIGQDERGNIVDGMQIFVETSDGVTFSVFVPMARYNVDEVKKIIQQRVDLISAVGGLHGSSTGG